MDEYKYPGMNPAGSGVRNSFCRTSQPHTGILGVLSILFLAGCAAITAYDATSYKNATDLKAEAILLIEKAKDPPGPHATAIENLRLKLRQAYEYENGKGSRNRYTLEQWALLSDPNGALLGGFLKKWETENRGQSPAFLEGISKNVAQAFDEIIKLESHKVKD